MKSKLLCCMTGFLISGTVQAIPVLPNGSLTDLGSFSAGSYVLTGLGLIDLCGNGTFSMRPDGTPNAPVTCSNYGSVFNPNGSFTADGSFGPAGSNARIGALISTLNASAYTGTNPTGAQSSDWSLVGFSSVVTLSQPGNIYAAVNDTFYPNNTGAFDVVVRPANGSVPEPESLALLLLGAAMLFAGRSTQQIR